MADITALIDIFSEVRTLLARAENDFDWSSWEDETAALEEIDGLLANLRAGNPPDTHTMRVLFAPTGPMQEVSLSSGWGNRFLELAERFDEVMAS
ncbi:hypothetical protein [Vitreimonas flagellata]|uniref:hypothetical protein n=1 Tax=Vitreimonas flagellata TaxID=2560861 RepID=UPI0010751684|nr:hypothetical protein [Vitreimonas flagellata]